MRHSRETKPKYESQRTSGTSRIVIAALAALLIAVPAFAGNGHLLHGVGAINSSLGGAGTGLPVEVIGALHANPALLTQIEDMTVGISAEIFVDDLSATTQLDSSSTPVTTDSDGEPGILPALGWSYNKKDSKWAYGFGLLAAAGFRTNWPVDEDSLLLQPQPVGFGRLSTELQVTKVPFAIAYQVNDKLSLGGSFNAYSSRLIIQPLPVVTPDCLPDTPPLQNNDCYRPSTGVMVTEFAFSLQVGLFYQINDAWSVGLSYTTEQDTDPYTWNSNHANPDITTGDNAFGNPREISIDLDQPPIASFGLGYTHSDNLRVAFDIRWVGYADTTGIGGSGGIDDLQRLVSIGWQDIWIGMLGIEYVANEKWTLRGGLNFNESPIQDDLTLNSGGTPSVFEEHYTFGASYTINEHFDFDIGGYYTPENEKTGPFIGIDGATVTLRNSILSGLVGFSFRF